MSNYFSVPKGTHGQGLESFDAVFQLKINFLWQTLCELLQKMY